MNKAYEVIVNGVDVSGCDFALNNSIKGKAHCPMKSMPYAKETSCIECRSRNIKYNFCKHNSNCYYKQLQREKRKNEELLKTAAINSDDFFHKLLVYRSTLENIKNVVDVLYCEHPETCWQNRADYTDDVYGCEPNEWDDPKELMECPSKLASAIRNIINEVLNE